MWSVLEKNLHLYSELSETPKLNIQIVPQSPWQLTFLWVFGGRVVAGLGGGGLVNVGIRVHVYIYMHTNCTHAEFSHTYSLGLQMEIHSTTSICSNNSFSNSLNCSLNEIAVILNYHCCQATPVKVKSSIEFGWYTHVNRTGAPSLCTCHKSADFGSDAHPQNLVSRILLSAMQERRIH